MQQLIWRLNKICFDKTKLKDKTWKWPRNWPENEKTKTINYKEECYLKINYFLVALYSYTKSCIHFWLKIIFNNINYYYHRGIYISF